MDDVELIQELEERLGVLARDMAEAYDITLEEAKQHIVGMLTESSRGALGHVHDWETISYREPSGQTLMCKICGEQKEVG